MTMMPFMALSENINLLSYNVYFDDEKGRSRYTDIIKLIKEGAYNVVALQECTPLFLSMLNRDNKLRYFMRQQGSLRDGYTNIILTSLKVKKSGNIKLASKMGRSVPFIVLHDSNMVVANLHLESGFFDSQIREQQINTILTQMEEKKN